MPTWAMYSLIAIGAFLLLCVAVWGLNALGKRRRPAEEHDMDDADLGLDDMY